MKFVIFGPAYGHNIKGLIDYCNTQNEYKIDFIFRGKSDYAKNTKIFNFVKFKIKNIGKILNILLKQNDLIWIHGGTNILLCFLILLLKRKKTKIIISIYDLRLPENVNKNSFKGYLNTKVLNMFDLVHCLWYSSSEILENKIQKLYTLHWGLPNEMFKSNNTISNTFVRELILQMPSDRYKFFLAKSFTNFTNHILIIEAAEKIVQSKITNFKIYLWGGNDKDSTYFEELKSLIAKKNLDNYIMLIESEFVSFSDMKNLIKSIDCGLVIVRSDQLSTAILEPLLFQKEVIATNIPAYKYLQTKLDLEFDLVLNQVTSIVNIMLDKIKGNLTNQKRLENNTKIIENNFNSIKQLQLLFNKFVELSNE